MEGSRNHEEDEEAGPGAMLLPSNSSNESKESEARAQARSLYLLRIWSAIFYAAASFLITVVNKLVLTSSGFPSFQVLALGQIVSTVVVLFFAKAFKLVTYPSLSKDTFRKIFPLPILFLGNAISGLGGTKELSLPMFTALRRFSILLTMLGEFYVLGTRPSVPVQISVYTMIGGATLAASNDLAFTPTGYSLIMVNNLFTAANGVYTKKRLESKEYGKYGLMYYNALFVLVPAAFLAFFTGDIEKALDYKGWSDPIFLLYFVMSCLMGFLLNASVVMCTQYNSALTTTIVGCLKNVSVTYLGMFIGGDYVFQALNFIGINISVFGSLLYTYVTFRR
jgi:solute carrier family 35 protein